MLKFVFDLPPSTNETYKAVYSSRLRRTVFFMAYPAKKWLKRAQELILIKGPGVSNTTMEMYITWFFKRERDIDGGIKLLIDAFEDTLLVNDSQVRILHIFKRFDKIRPRVEVEFNPIIPPKEGIRKEGSEVISA